MARKARRGGGGTSAPRNTLRTGDDCPTHLPRPPKPIASAGRSDLATGRGGPASPRGPRPPWDVHRPHSEDTGQEVFYPVIYQIYINFSTFYLRDFPSSCGACMIWRIFVIFFDVK